MDIFIRNVPIHSTTDQLKDFLRTYLLRLDVLAFEVKKSNNKTFAILSLHDLGKARQFIAFHGSSFPSYPVQPLLFPGSLIPLSCTQSKISPDQYLHKSLQLADKTTREKQTRQPKSAGPHPKGSLKADFPFRALSCGAWSYQNSELTFNPYYQDKRAGKITFGIQSLVILLHRSGDPFQCRVDVPYLSIQHVISGESSGTITLTLGWPPKIYEDSSSQTQDLAATLNSLSISSQREGPQDKRLRLSSIDRGHDGIAGHCFVYQILLPDRGLIDKVIKTINRRAAIPQHYKEPTLVGSPRTSFVQDYNRLTRTLADYDKHRALSYRIRFQIERLANNGILPPSTVHQLLPYLVGLVTDYTTDSVATAIRRLSFLVQFPGPLTNANDFTSTELMRNLRQHTESAYREQEVEKKDHLAIVHKVLITPCGMLLTGPDPEVTNRVLRKYAEYHEYFLRVTFADEDAMPVHFDSRANQERIYHGRFEKVLDNGINIAGRVFKFLGFSHSSLRSQSCWFMAPFTVDGNLVFSQDVIRGLGNFTAFRSPAKCAARIGQAFSDTFTSIALPDSARHELPDTERNGRVFSDGCGTISMKLLRRVWLEYAPGRSPKPTILQIRFAGVKGVVSLDSRLDGDMLCIRPSMEKFYEAPDRSIELCGGSFKPLPLHLNRQFIKILEDLGVPPEAFENLQASVERQLREVTLHTVNAALFLRWAHLGEATETASLFENLHKRSLDFRADDFLTDMIEIAVLSKLREIKHRARIPVKDGCNLYGIMDETGYLQEGQIYVATEKTTDGKQEKSVLIRKRVVITRAPALHPGDIQVVEAIDVPSNSPLKSLYNCVVFSQHGERDLPSCLSGGDLDGDLYQVIWDPTLIPKDTCKPADYPRVGPIDIGRQIQTKDMTDFFIQFMETDQLGRISTLHQILADKHASGTFHPECIKLAEMASTAVDFSKTGIPVDLSKLPRTNSTARPDFMATGPRVFVESKGAVLEDAEDLDEDEVDPVSALDPDTRKYRYYESEKVLGKLYRAIDEAKFFGQMQRDSKSMKASDPKKLLMRKLLKDVARETWELGLPYDYENHADLARKLREKYENTLVETMSQYSTHPAHPLNELEVFSGSILGKSLRAASKQIRENATAMNERFGREVSAIIREIRQGHPDDEEEDYYVEGGEALLRSLACFENSMMEPGGWPMKKLVSWRYVCAAVALQELGRVRLRLGRVREGVGLGVGLG